MGLPIKMQWGRCIIGKPDAPEPPDPQETAAAQTGQNVVTAQANQVLGNINQQTPYGNLTYYFQGPNGQLISPSDMNVNPIGGGAAPSIETVPGKKEIDWANSGDGEGRVYTTGPETYRIGNQTFDTRAEAEAALASMPAPSGGNSTGGYTFTDPNSGQTYTLNQMTAVQEFSPEQQALFDTNMATQGQLSRTALEQATRLKYLLDGGVDMTGVQPRANFNSSEIPDYQQYGPGPDLLTGVANAGQNIRTHIPDAGRIASEVNTPNNFQTGIDAGNITSSVNATGGQLMGFGGAGDLQRSLGPTGNIQTSVNIPQIGAIGGVGGGAANFDINYDPSELPTLNTTFGDTPSLNLDANLAGFSGPSSAPQISFNPSQLGGIQSQFGATPDVQTNANAQAIRDVQGAEGVTFNRRDLGQGNAQGIGDVSEILRGFDQGPGPQFNLGDAGEITNTYGIDFSEDRQRVEDALMQRMDPYLQRDRDALEARLASQGIRYGSEAYQDAMSDFNRQSNDARLGAILGAGQEQSRLANLEAQRAGFQNSAQQQLYNQLLGRQQAFNNAQAQNFGQNATQAQFANAAQAQEYGQAADRARFSTDQQGQLADQLLRQDALDLQAQTTNADIQGANANRQLQRDIAANAADMDAARFGNDAIAQMFGQNLARGQFANEAQAQGAQQAITQDNQRLDAATTNANLAMDNNRLNLDRENLMNQLGLDQFAAENTARNQAFDQAFARGQFGNDALTTQAGLQFDQDRLGVDAQEAQGRLNLQAQGNALNASEANARLALDAQRYNQQAALDAAQFANNAQAQQFAQALGAAQFGNDTQQQAFNQAQTQANFYNDASTQQLLNQLGIGNFQNAAQAQGFDQSLAQGNFANDATQQMFNNELAAGNFANAAQQQLYNQNADRMQFNNDAQQQQFDQLLANLGVNNAAQTQMFQDQNFVTGANNDLASQGFQDYLTGMNAQNANRAADMDERYQARNQPINEIAALLSGSQVQNPNFVNTNGVNMPTTDVAGIINSNFNQQMNNYNAQMGAWNNIWGGLLGAGGMWLGG